MLIDQGQTLRRWFEITLHLCHKAYSQNNLAWLAEVIEGGLPIQVKKIHRLAHAAGAVTVPLFARPDMSALGVTVEVQTPGSGWGYQTAIHATVNSTSRWIGPVAGFQAGVEYTTGCAQSAAAYILYNQPFFREVEYFCKQCNEFGMNLEMCFQHVPDPETVKFVRRPPLEDLLGYSDGHRLIEKSLRRELVLEPSPSLLFDQKIAIAFPFHPQLREHFPDSVRNLFPETHLVRKDMSPTFENQPLNWDDLVGLSRSKRQFILKFGGAKKELRAGGKAVYNLADHSHREVQALLQSAFTDWEENRSPWLIQKRVQKKYLITYFDHHTGQLLERDCYAMFRPMYFFTPYEDLPQIIAFSGLFRKEWKVHGSSDTVMMPVETAKTESSARG